MDIAMDYGIIVENGIFDIICFSDRVNGVAGIPFKCSSMYASIIVLQKILGG